MGRVGSALSPGRNAEWTFVVGHGFLAAVPAGTRAEIVAALCALVTEPRVELESVVALLPLSGDDEVDSFVVIVPAEPTDGDGIPVSAVVRGAIAADVFSVGGSRRFTDRDIRPWLLADFQAVIGIVIGSPLAAVVQADRLHSGTQLGEGAVAGNTLFWSLAGRPEGMDAPVARAQDPIGMAQADTILRPGRVAEDTVVDRAPVGWAVRADAARPDAQPEPPVPEPARYGFRLPDGVDRRLDLVYYLGRHPQSPRITTGRPPRLVTVSSPTSAVSGTHLEIRQEGDSVVVTDLRSTNGTIVRPPRGRRQRLRAGQSLAVVPGTTVDIGDGNIIEILR